MTTCPPASRLATFLAISDIEAKALRTRIKRGCLRRDYDLPRDCHYSHAASLFMDELNAIAGGVKNGFFGCETLYPSRPEIFYLNSGDSYSPTLIYNALSRTVRLGCIGDIIERMPAARCEY